MNEKISWLTVFKRLGLFILTFAVLSAVTIAPLATVFSRWADSAPTQSRVYADVAGALAVLLASWIMTRFADKRPFVSLGLMPRPIIHDLPSGLALGALWLGASVGILVAAGWASLQELVAFSAGALLIAGVSVLFNVLTQQLLVFGFILQTVRAKAGLPTAVIASALLFSAIHAAAFGSEWIPPVNVFGAGLVFGLAYGVTGNLWLPVGIHFAWNMLLGPVLGLTISGSGSLGLGWTAFEIAGPEMFTGGAFGIEGGLVVTFTTFSLAALLLVLYARHNAEGADQERMADADQLIEI